jgi:sortase (surface protein transpeptidase)
MKKVIPRALFALFILPELIFFFPKSAVSATSAVTIAPFTRLPSGVPTRLIIPAIALNVSIDDEGVNAKGELDVPSGATDHVGWYKDGPTPGQVGSAVFDAHVFAAFKNLNKVVAGDDIYVTTSTGQRLHFVVDNNETFALKGLPATTLFAPAETAELNLITCAGKLTPDHSTYDHRLIAFSHLVDVGLDLD